ncbi:MAG: M3 family metallopeptidase [Nannocystaceae bacterium]
MVAAPESPLLRLAYEIPFDQITADQVEPSIHALLADARAQIEAIAGRPEPRTYDDLLGALESALEPLEVAITIVSHLESVATTPALRAAYNAVQGPVAELFASIPLHEGLWRALRGYADTAHAKALTGARARHLQKTLDDFRHSGAELDPAGKARLQAIDVELAEITQTFSEHVLDATNAFELVITDEARLAGLPESARIAARESAAAHGQAGWRFTLQAPSVIPALTYLDDRALREQIWRAYNRRGADAPHDNRGLIVRILELRREKAALLGFATFADLVLSDRMAKGGAEATRFVDDLRRRAEGAFHGEREALDAFARGLGASTPLAPWDVAYYAEKQRHALYDFDDEALRPYLPAEAAVDGVFTVMSRLYGVTVARRDDLPTWDPTARVYDLHDRAGRHLGIFHVDLYPRESKRGGAWMNALRTAARGVDEAAPHVGLICANVTPATADRPALLTHDEVETLFHEFGHLMHHLLTEVEVRSLAGTNVAWDFVELPSQIMENWCWERGALDLFARHYETGAPIPGDLLEKMLRARNYRSASATMRQLGFAAVDLALHTTYDPAKDGDPLEFGRRLAADFAPTELPDDYAMLAGFTHIFAGAVGYAAGYYSYKWAEVLDADAFTRFQREGILDPEVGAAFRESILARGDSDDPLALFRSFMGRDPDPDALLVRSGLAAASAE